MTAFGFVIASTGAFLVWSGIKGENPVSLIVGVLSGERKIQPPTKADTSKKGK